MITTTQSDIAKQFKQAGIETAVLDARLLVMHVLGFSLEELLMRRHDEFPTELKEKLGLLVQKRLQGMPIAKIIGVKEFWGLSFKTTQDTLDPRPDSETLIEAVLENFSDRTKPYRLLDLGTGTGCLLISLLHELPNATGIGIDQSPKALAVAEKNATDLGVIERSTWIESNWFSAVKGQFDIIISNPPYIPSSDIETLSRDVKQYDPLSALDGGEDGVAPYRHLAEHIMPFLREKGIVALEYGQGQSEKVSAIFNKKTPLKPFIYKDLAGIDRCTIFKE